MLDALKRLFATDKQDLQTSCTFAEEDPRVAVAALLVHLIAVDGVVDDDERMRIRAVLSERFELQSQETEELLALAQKRDESAVDLYAFTSSIKSNFDFDQRRDVVEMLWEMVYADGEVHEFEDNVVWRVAELLGISTRDRVTIRKRVEQKLSS